jgi:hypothetical protein
MDGTPACDSREGKGKGWSESHDDESQWGWGWGWAGLGVERCVDEVKCMMLRCGRVANLNRKI